MSADKFTSIYHLTQRGWEAGARGSYLSEKEEAASLPPVDRLLTLRYHESTPYIKTHYSCSVDYITNTRYEKLLWAILTYGVYPPAMVKQIDQYEQDEQLAKIFAGMSVKQTQLA